MANNGIDSGYSNYSGNGWPPHESHLEICTGSAGDGETGYSLTGCSPVTFSTYNHRGDGGGGGGGGIQDRLAQLRDLLAKDPNCLAFLNSAPGADVLGQFDAAIDNPGLVGTADIPATADRIFNAETGFIPGQSITINNNGAYFLDSFQGTDLRVDRGRFRGGTQPAQLFILLHEFGHVMDVLTPQETKQSQVDKNDKTLDQKCKNLISSFPK